MSSVVIGGEGFDGFANNLFKARQMALQEAEFAAKYGDLPGAGVGGGGGRARSAYAGYGAPAPQMYRNTANIQHFSDDGADDLAYLQRNPALFQAAQLQKAQQDEAFNRAFQIQKYNDQRGDVARNYAFEARQQALRESDAKMRAEDRDADRTTRETLARNSLEQKKLSEQDRLRANEERALQAEYQAKAGPLNRLYQAALQGGRDAEAQHWQSQMDALEQEYGGRKAALYRGGQTAAAAPAPSDSEMTIGKARAAALAGGDDLEAARGKDRETKDLASQAEKQAAQLEREANILMGRNKPDEAATLASFARQVRTGKKPIEESPDVVAARSNMQQDAADDKREKIDKQLTQLATSSTYDVFRTRVNDLVKKGTLTEEEGAEKLGMHSGKATMDSLQYQFSKIGAGAKAALASQMLNRMSLPLQEQVAAKMRDDGLNPNDPKNARAYEEYTRTLAKRQKDLGNGLRSFLQRQVVEGKEEAQKQAFSLKAARGRMAAREYLNKIGQEPGSAVDYVDLQSGPTSFDQNNNIVYASAARRAALEDSLGNRPDATSGSLNEWGPTGQWWNTKRPLRLE